MWRAASLVSVVAACSFEARTSPASDAADVDAPASDAPDDGPRLCSTWTSAQRFDPCQVEPTGEWPVLPAGVYTYDTTTDGGKLTRADTPGTVLYESALTITQSDNTIVAVAAVPAVSIPPGVEIRVVGAKPWLLVSWSTIAIGGEVDAHSVTDDIDPDAQIHTSGSIRMGPGAASTKCGEPQQGHAGTDAHDGGGSGGGGGGGFQGKGGNGTVGDMPNPVAGGPGGMPLGSEPAVIRTGCFGGASGKAGPDDEVIAPSDDNTVSVGGAPGGAMHFAAREKITLEMNAFVHAGGAGGGGARERSACGGGGGGSGGYLGFEAPMIEVQGGVRVFAQGGGGGASGPFNGFGNDGSDAEAAVPALGGVTGQSGVCGLSGANGSSNLDGVSATGNDGCGGGGGGGAAGFIMTWGMLASAGTISPPANQH